MRFFVFALLAVVAVSAQKAGSDEICVPNIPFKRYCNACVCTPEGKPGRCTQTACPPGMYNRDGTVNEDVLVSFDIAFNENTATDGNALEGEQVCEPNKTFKRYCNNCKCNEAGTSFACTKALCQEGLYNLDGTMNVEDVFILKDKSEKVPRRICEPDTTFKKMCNMCRCNSDGTEVACTKALCPEAYNKDGTINY